MKYSSYYSPGLPCEPHTRPLTPSEERFMILAQRYPNTGAFNEHCGFEIEGELNISILHQSVQIVCSRHIALRSCAVLTSKKAMIEVVPHVNIQVPVNDMCTATEESLAKKVKEMAQVPFNIEEPPLFRLQLFRIQAHKWLLVMVMHHIISDGDPSFTIFAKEVGACYEAILGNKTPTLAEPINPFLGFVSAPKQEQLYFWSHKLKGITNVVNLPWQHNPLKKLTFQAETVTISIPAQVTEELTKLAQLTNAYRGVEALLLSIFQLLLHRYSSQADISVGYPTYNRSKENKNFDTIGYFGNPVVIRTDFSTPQSFSQLFAKASENLKMAFQNNCPFQDVVDAVDPEWHKNARTPLFNTLFVFGMVPEVILAGDIQIKQTQIDLGLVPYDIILTVRHSSVNSLLCSLQYNSEILHEKVMASFLKCFVSLCKSVPQNLTCCTSSIPMLYGDEVPQQIKALNLETACSNYPKEKCIHEIFRECAKMYPQSVAVSEVNEGMILTYHELDVASDNIFLKLLRHVKPRESVGLLMERSAITVVSILGILKSGCSYIPIDTQSTSQRIKLSISQCSINHILCSRKCEAMIATLELGSTIVVQVIDKEILSEPPPEKETVVSLSSQEIAYTMVTSGTTGKPKAVDIPHMAVVRIVHGNNYIQFGSTDVSLLHSPLNFDASTFELWSVLLNGGTLVISTQERSSPAELAKQVYSHDVTIVWLTSGLFNVMMDLHIDMFCKVHHILTGGDVVSTDKVQLAQAKLPSCFFYNMYGPTEGTTFTTYYIVPDNFSRASVAQVPIGIPVSNTRIYILDDNLMPVPIGMSGNLYIGGDGVAKGYRNEALNHKAFIIPPPHILAVFPEEGKLYNSGDIVRILPDPLKNDAPVVHFIGRCDQQVKVSGIRVDLTEVENTLLQYPAIQHASVVAKNDKADEKHLVAYVVLDQDVKASDLQSHVKQHLPAYMVPTKFFAIDQIPLNTNDKVHQKQLQTLEGSSKFQILYSSSHRKPETVNEKCIAQVWANELHVSEEVITMRFDFFENGGHSLVAQRMASRLSDILDVDVSITTVYCHPVFEEFAKVVTPSQCYAKEEYALNMENLSAISFQQEEFALLEKIGKYSTVNNVFAALLLHEELDKKTFEVALNKVVQNHQILHSLFHDTEGTTETIRSPLLCTVHVTTTTLKKGTIIEDTYPLINEYIAEMFDYERGPLMRCQLYEIEKMTVVVLVLHHIIADDITAWLVMQEAISHSSTAAQEEKDAYQLYVLQQKAKQGTPKHSTDLCYWEDKLAKVSVLPNFEIYQDGIPLGSRASLPVNIQVLSVKQACSQYSASPVEVVLAAFYLSIHTLTGSNHVYITSPFSNRNDEMTSRLVGPTANRVVLHLKLPVEKCTPKSLLQMVRKELAETLQYQHVPVKVQYPLVGFSFTTLSSEVLPDRGEPLWIPYSNIPDDQLIFMDIKATSNEIKGFLHYDQGYVQQSYMLEFIQIFQESIAFISRSEPDVQMPNPIPTALYEPGSSMCIVPFRRLLYNSKLLNIGRIENEILRDVSIRDCYIAVVKEGNNPKIYIYVQANGNRRINDDQIMRLARTLPPNVVITQVSSLPRNEEGQISENELQKILVLDPTLQNQVLSAVTEYIPHAKLSVRKRHKSMSNSKSITALPSVNKRTQPRRLEEEKSNDKEPIATLSQVMKGNTPEESMIAHKTKPPTTMVAALQRTASNYPTKGITFIEEESTHFMSYTELYQSALQYKSAFELLGLTKGNFVILLISKPRKLVPLWWGCVVHGIVPTIVAKALTYKEISGKTEKLHHVWKTLNQAIIFTDDFPEDIKKLQQFYPEFQNAKVVSLSTMEANKMPEVCDAILDNSSPNDLLFLQLSSGSTGAPKCIQELNNRVICHIISSTCANNYSHTDRTLSWIPMDHVVPILTFHLKDTFLGCSQHMVDVSIVLSNPLNWLRLITEYSITHTWAPNFGYALVAKSVTEASEEEKQTIELSTLKSLINAGEMVTPGTIRSFLQATLPMGLKESAVQPSFGMAETATLFTYHNTVGLKSKSWTHQYGDYEFVNLGPPMQGVAIRVTDEVGCELHDGEIGELEICGEVITPGYLFNEKASKELFRDGWMRSGDHAFIVNGNLFITGRIKEQIVLRGVKYFCHEIEEKVNQVKGVTPTYSAAFGVENVEKGTEELVIIFCPSHPDSLPKHELHRIIKKIHLTINKYFGIVPSQYVVLTQTQFQKTTSGKIQRVAMKKNYLEGQYISSTLSSWLPPASNLHIPAHALAWEPFALQTVERQSKKVFVILHLEHSELSSLIEGKLKSKQCIPVSISHHRNQLLLSEPTSGTLITQKASKQSYIEAWHKLLSLCGFIDVIVNIVPYDNQRDRDEMNLSSPWSDEHNQQLLYLLQSLEVLPKHLQIKLLNVTSQSACVTTSDFLKPTRSLMSSLIGVATKELPGQFCLLEVDLPECRCTSSTDLNTLSSAIIQEALSTHKETQVAYRNLQRHVPRLKEIDLFENVSKEEKVLPEGGVYILSGGTGGVGRFLSVYLHKYFNAKLILIGRQPKTSTNVQDCLTFFDGHGVHYTYIEGDISREETIEAILRVSKSQQISGAFHLATAYEEKSIKNLTVEDLQTAMVAKVKGAVKLYDFLYQHSKNAVLVLFSSIYSVLPVKGLMAYSAANKFLEMFQHHCSATNNGDHDHNIRTVCISWPVWKNTGLSKGHTISDVGEVLGVNTLEPDTALQLLDPLLQQEGPIYVGLSGDGPIPISHKTAEKFGLPQNELLLIIDKNTIDEQFKPEALVTALQMQDIKDTFGNRLDTTKVQIHLSSAVVQQEHHIDTGVHSHILTQWKQILSIPKEKHLSTENFYEMGGDSLQIAQLVSTLNKTFNLHLSPLDIMEHPTVSDLASIVSALMSVEMTPVKPNFSQAMFTSHSMWHLTHESQQSKPTEVHLFCLPYIGMPTHLFKDWSFPGVTVWSTFYPVAPCTMQDLVSTLASGVFTIVQEHNVPFVILGHSFGSLLAIDIYQHLCNQNMPLPFLLVVCSMYSPLKVAEGSQLAVGTQHLSDIADDRVFLMKLREKGFDIEPEKLMTSPELKPTIEQFRYLYRLYEQYKCPPGMRVDCPIEILGGVTDHVVTPSDLQEWSKCTIKTTNVTLFPGDHFFIQKSGSKVFAKVVSTLLSHLYPADDQ